MAFGIDDAILAAGISAGGQLLGGAIGGGTDGARDNRRQTLKLYKQGGVALREGAERAGFNPLTYAQLMAGSSVSGGGTGGGMTFGEAVANAGTAIGNGILEAEQIKLQQTELDQRERELEHRIAQADKRDAQRSVFAGGVKLSTDPDMLQGGSGYKMGDPPRARPAPMSETIPVYNQSGTLLKMDKRTADRLKIQPFDPIIQEDIEALAGDVLSEVQLIGHTPKLHQQYFGDWDIFGSSNAGTETYKKPSRTMPEPGWMDKKFGKGNY